MPGWTAALSRHWRELRRRRVFRTLAAYLVFAWLLLQVADVTFQPLGLPPWSQRALIIVVVSGLLPTALLAWIFDIRAGRIVRTPALEAGPLPAQAFVAPAGAPGAAAPGAPAAHSAIASIAILPFSDLSPQRDQSWFCDGLAEEIIDALCCVRGLRVASRSASFLFRDGSVDPREIGRRLAVDVLLEGSVRRAENRVRISAQLVDTQSGYHLWSDRFDRALEDVFALQGEIATAVAKALQLSMKSAASGRGQRHAPANMEAWEYYLRGRQLAGQTTEIAWRRAPQMFRRAIELDPDYAPAHAGLADSLAQQILWRYARAEDVQAEAEAAAARALELAPDSAEAHVAQGNLRSMLNDHEGAVRAFERAIEINPDLHEAWYYYARRAYARGDTARAAELFQAAYRTRPDEYVVLALAINALDASGQRAAADALAPQALVGLQRQVELDPENARLHYFLAGMLQRAGQREAGIVHAETALRLRPNDFATLYNVACFYNLGGDCERALDLLERAVQSGGGYPEWIMHDEDLASLRAHPRFQALIAAIKQA